MNQQQSVANMHGGFWQVLRAPLCHEKASGQLCGVLNILPTNLVGKISVDGTAQTRQPPSATDPHCHGFYSSVQALKGLQDRQLGATSY